MVLDIKPKTRIPKSYFRFRGLTEEALSGKDGNLVKVHRSTIRELVRKTIAPDIVFGLSVQGKNTELEELAGKLMAADRPCVLVGGFPHGHFTPETLSLVDELVRIHEMPLEAHVVTSRLLYEFEKALMVVNR
jgi:rRNA small subunit pseudouridine methyltransferase Nep1